MTTEQKPSRAGLLWLVLIFTPAVVIVSGLIAMFVWQARTGTITPKWRKPPPAALSTNLPATPPSTSPPPAPPSLPQPPSPPQP